MGAKGKARADPLSTYRAKRSLDRTPEPGARAAPASPSAGGLFVVHMHAARRLHWDLRLEMDGVLKSWAVPKGPSPNRADKRLAVHVEDHPLEYGDFEGLIPEGNYGAGAVIVWDRGVWVPLEDAHEGMQKGKLLFELRGYKLRGKWTLVKIKRGEKEWLLIKEKDGYVQPDSALPPESVLSGLTVEELKAGKDRAEPIVKELARLKAPRRAVRLEEAEPMLAEVRERPFSKPGWLFELKLDGYRIRAGKENGVARLITRNGHDIAAQFSEIARAVAALPYDPCRSSSARRSSRGCSRTWDRSSMWSTSRRTARRCTSRSCSLAWKESSRRRRIRPTARAARPTGSRFAPTEPTTSWWSGSRGPRDRARGSARSTWGRTRTGSSSTPGGPGAGSPRPSSRR